MGRLADKIRGKLHGAGVLVEVESVHRSRSSGNLPMLRFTAENKGHLDHAVGFAFSQGMISPELAPRFPGEFPIYYSALFTGEG